MKIPYNETIERAILSSLMIYPAVVDEYISEISQNDFYNAVHKKIFKIVQSLYLEKKAIDLITVASQMQDYADLVADLFNNFPSQENFSIYFKELKQYSIARNAIVCMRNYAQKLAESPVVAEDTIRDANEELNLLMQSQEKVGFTVSVQDILPVVSEKIYELKRGKLFGLPTGIEQIDKTFLGIQPGLYVIAARPHMGKSTFAIRLAYQLALNGAKTLFCPLEDGVDTMTLKLLALLSGVHYKALLQGYFQEDVFSDALNNLNSLKLDFVNLRFDALQLRNYIARNRRDIDVVFIDQVSHVKLQTAGGYDYRVKLNEAIREIKGIAKDFNIPVFLLAQISRKVEDRSDKRPLLSDLKETGNLEEDADVIMFLYRDKYYNQSAKEDILEVRIAKNKITEELTTLKFKELRGVITSA